MAQAEKMRLDIPVPLPGVDDARDRCVKRLIAGLSQMKNRCQDSVELNQCNRELTYIDVVA